MAIKIYGRQIEFRAESLRISGKNIELKAIKAISQRMIDTVRSVDEKAHKKREWEGKMRNARLVEVYLKKRSSQAAQVPRASSCGDKFY